MHKRMTRGRFAWLMLLAMGSMRCGGAPFTSDEAAGSGALGGSGGLPTAGTPGEPEPEEGGSTGVDPGTAGSKSGVTLDLTECGADAFGTNVMPTLYSTLDSAPAIVDPAIGELGFVGNAEDDYRGGRCGTGTNIDQPGDYIKYHYQDNGVRHFDPLMGALDFWYMPAFSHTDGTAHHLFGTANFAALGGIRMTKAGADAGNELVATFRGGQMGDLEIEVSAHDYALSPATWTRFTLVWHLAPSLPQRFTRLFIDGELVGEALPSATFQMAPDLDGFFLLGVWDLDDRAHAAGIFDELKVFPRSP